MKTNIADKLLKWYDPELRQLPWKASKDPYKIWLSEIILQQTRVAQGMPYYLKFVERFPTIENLANAPQDEILKLWEGLGYYSRARNLHTAAKQVMEEFGGKFPNTYSSIIKLKGVGDYTASAIASFAFNESTAVVDGNVYRFLSRIFGIEEAIDSSIGKKLFKEYAQKNIDIRRPDLYNQAIMDFGALICKPANPDCVTCPFQSDCIAYNTGEINMLPYKSKKIKKKDRYFNFYVFYNKDQIIVHQRTLKDIWKGLYQFPKLESKDHLLTVNDIDKNSTKWMQILNDNASKKLISKTFKQTLTHQNIKAQFILIENPSLNIMELPKNVTLIKVGELSNFAFPKIINDFLSEFQDIYEYS